MQQDIKYFKESLFGLYGNDNKNLEGDIEYLWDAFQQTEELWWKNIERIKKVKYVLIAEAPLYGEKCSFIYNPETSGTAFLGLTTVAKISNYLGNPSKVESKIEMLSKMREMGLVVLDLFPFAFNKDTTCQFGRLSEKIRTSLARSCSPWFLKPKLKEIIDRSEGRLTFGVRYSRLHTFAKDIIDSSVPKGVTPNVILACRRVANAPLDIEAVSEGLR